MRIYIYIFAVAPPFFLLIVALLAQNIYNNIWHDIYFFCSKRKNKLREYVVWARDDPLLTGFLRSLWGFCSLVLKQPQSTASQTNSSPLWQILPTPSTSKSCDYQPTQGFSLPETSVLCPRSLLHKIPFITHIFYGWMYSRWTEIAC